MIKHTSLHAMAVVAVIGTLLAGAPSLRAAEQMKSRRRAGETLFIGRSETDELSEGWIDRSSNRRRATTNSRQSWRSSSTSRVRCRARNCGRQKMRHSHPSIVSDRMTSFRSSPMTTPLKYSYRQRRSPTGLRFANSDRTAIGGWEYRAVCRRQQRRGGSPQVSRSPARKPDHPAFGWPGESLVRVPLPISETSAHP